MRCSMRLPARARLFGSPTCRALPRMILSRICAVRCIGSASIGALRAFELARFGMRGIGGVYEDFRDGVLQDDDEVAVLHGPAELGYPPVTEAMVNIRATLAAAARDGVLKPELAAALTD